MSGLNRTSLQHFHFWRFVRSFGDILLISILNIYNVILAFVEVNRISENQI
jgi:hypothetical protein